MDSESLDLSPQPDRERAAPQDGGTQSSTESPAPGLASGMLAAGAAQLGRGALQRKIARRMAARGPVQTRLVQRKGPGDPKDGGEEVSDADKKARKGALEKVEDLLSYGVFDWAITDAEATRALTMLADLSPSNRKGVLDQLAQKFKTRLLDNVPAALKHTANYTKVLMAMGPDAVLPYITNLLSYGVFDWVITDAEAREVITVASALSADQRRQLYDRMGPQLRQRLMDELPQDGLGTRARATTPTRDSSLKPGETRYSIWDELIVAIGSIPVGVMGSHQQSRIRPALDALSPTDYDAFRALTKATRGLTEQAFLFKALAANNSIADIQWLASQIAGKGQDWLLDNCTLGDPRQVGGGIRQQYSHTCGVTTVQMVRGEYDPIYALRMRQANANISQADNDDPSLINPQMAAEQRAMHTTATGGASDGHKGKAVPRSKLAEGVGRWVVDWLNEMQATTGLVYDTVKDPGAPSAISTLDSKVGAGMMTPTVIGNGAGQYTHYILCMHTRKESNGKRSFQFHDPWDAVTVWTPEDDITNGIMNIANSNMITALEVPKAA